jgi:hypothetical protein
LALGLWSLVAAGCGGNDGYLGPSVRLTGSFNGWVRGELAPELTWDGHEYRGVMTLPGENLELQVFVPSLLSSLESVGSGASVLHGVPAQVTVSEPGAGGSADSVSRTGPMRWALPLPARYEVVYSPQQRTVHVDFSDDATVNQPVEAALLIEALRNSDQLSPSEQHARGLVLAESLRAKSVELPFKNTFGEQRGLTFLHLGAVDWPALSLVGDFNGWRAGVDPMTFVLDGTIAYQGKRASGARLEYRFDLHGQRYADPQNLEVMWDGSFLPPNPSNLLGGNLGELNSVAMAPGYFEPGSRLRRFVGPDAPEGQPRPDVLIYLPPGYSQATTTSYPTLYVLDGKDAVVRGGYPRLLERLTQAGKTPPVVGVFVSSPSDPAVRLSALASYPDATFSEIIPRGDAFTRWLVDGLLPQVEKSFRVTSSRALLGIDMAGPLVMSLAWKDAQRRFPRVASQSGRFGWGDPLFVGSPYLKLLQTDAVARVERLTFDYSDVDHPQAQVHDSTIRPALSAPGYLSKVQFVRSTAMPADPWESLRLRAEQSLPFLLRDLAPVTK